MKRNQWQVCNPTKGPNQITWKIIIPTPHALSNSFNLISEPAAEKNENAASNCAGVFTWKVTQDIKR